MNTRLRKLDDDQSEYAALVLAYAGMHRLGWNERITQVLQTIVIKGDDKEKLSSDNGFTLSSFPCLHAVGQGTKYHSQIIVKSVLK